MDACLTLKEHHTRCMRKPRAAEATLRTLTTTSGIDPGSITAVQVACVQAVALCSSELWWDPKEVGMREDLQLLLNWQARSILCALPTTPQGALLRDSALTPGPIILDSRQLQFAVRRAEACISNLTELPRNTSSGAPICNGVKHEYSHG